MTVKAIGKLYKTNDRPITKLLHQSTNEQVKYKLIHPGYGIKRNYPKRNTIRNCEVCNSDNSVCFNELTQKYLCGRHRNQVTRYGKVLSGTYVDKNEIIIFNNHAEIVLLNKKYEEVGRARISLNKIDKAKHYNWRSANSSDVENSYVIAKNHKQTILLHRYLMDAQENEDVDHIDRKKLNNINENLRLVCVSENQANKSIMKNNTSGVVGVTWDKSRNKWKASLNIYNHCYNLGRYDNFEDAVKVRLEAEKKYHKEFTPIERQNISEAQFNEMIGRN